MKRAISLLMMCMLMNGCAMRSDIKIGEMLPGEITSLSDGNVLPMEVEVIRASDVNFRMTAYNPKTGEKFQGKGSGILAVNVSSGSAFSTGTSNSGSYSAQGFGSASGTAVAYSNAVEETAVLIGDKGTVLNIKMRAQIAIRKSQLHGYGEAEDNKGNKYQVRY